MYPGTRFEIVDQSNITRFPINEQVNAPLFMQAFASDKGPEDMRVVYGDEFKIYGDISFAKYGQPLLNTATLINNGAKVLCKRVVAPDATLANLIISAKVKKEEKQKTNGEGKPLYTTPEGEETTTAESNSPIMETKAIITYETSTVASNKNDLTALRTAAFSTANYEGVEEDQDATFPLFLIADNGRGISSKNIHISADYGVSRTSKFTNYNIQVFDGATLLEKCHFALDPDTNSSSRNLSLESVAKTDLKEVKAYVDDEILRAFIERVRSITKMTDTDIRELDILFGNNKKGQSIPDIVIRGDVNLSDPVGLALASGTNGKFASNPLATDEYKQELIKFFNGTFTDEIYDLDNIALDGIIDANYPQEVKAAIESLIEFREDAFYFRDLGTGLEVIDDIVATADLATPSRYVGVYGNSYDVIDPYSKKQITVTTGYSLCRLLPNHFSHGCHMPLAGQLHEFTFPEIIEGTLNFAPKVTPKCNQREILFDKHVNFIYQYEGVYTMESCYTTQKEYTGFSFIQNTLAVQQVVKAIRSKCPKIRYSFITDNDLRKYQEDVQAILNKFTANFELLEMQYGADKMYENDMTYYAILHVNFKEFIQSEYFKIIALA